MTVREVYENVLRELRKTKAPAFHLEDFVYYSNKGIQEYVNLCYNVFQTSQQSLDDLQALVIHATGTLNANETQIIFTDYTGNILHTTPVTRSKRYNSDCVIFTLPESYQHWLGAHAEIKNRRPLKCYPAGTTFVHPVKALTSDIANQIMTNSYARPDAAFGRVFYMLGDSTVNNAIVKPSAQIFFGSAATYGMGKVNVDFLKAPARINLTVQERDSPLDTSASLEFPEYVCNEIVKHIVKLTLEASSDPRLQTHIPINTTIPKNLPQAK